MTDSHVPVTNMLYNAILPNVSSISLSSTAIDPAAKNARHLLIVFSNTTQLSYSEKREGGEEG